VDQKKPAWVPGSTIKPCTGCGIVGEKRKPCNHCQLQGIMRQKQQKYSKETKKVNEKLLRTAKQKSKEEKTKEHDNRYNKKLGIVNRTNVLLGQERLGDAYNMILGAVRIVKVERLEKMKEKKEQEQNLRTLLEIPLDVKINYKKLKAEPITEQRLNELGINVPLEKIQMLIAKMNANNPNTLTKNEYLNEEVLRIHNDIYVQMKNTRKDLMNLKERKEKLESEGENVEKKRPRTSKKRKLSSRHKMCKNILETGKCTNKSCEYPHSAIELDFEGDQGRIRNLEKTIMNSTKRLLKSKAAKPWKPSRASTAEPSTNFNKLNRKCY